MRIFTMMAEMGHEQVMFCQDAASGYRGIIAIHSTVLGPAVGVLSGGADLFGWSAEKVRAKVLAIYDTLLSVFAIAQAERIPTYKAADQLAERRLRGGVQQGRAG